MKRKEQVKNLEDILAQYRAKIEERERELTTLKSELVGFQKAYNAIKGKPPERGASMIPPLRAPRSNVKQTVLDLLQQAGASGLNAAGAVELAAKRNEVIHQPTVSSLLSRFKSDGVAVYDGSVYRLKQFASPEGENNSMH
jgi:hypothetical protein